ncbi:hypothetical protein CBL_11584 [Carabus blaptoides fortunei]
MEDLLKSRIKERTISLETTKKTKRSKINDSLNISASEESWCKQIGPKKGYFSNYSKILKGKSPDSVDQKSTAQTTPKRTRIDFNIDITPAKNYALRPYT